LSTSATGRLADENHRPWEGFTVAVSDVRALFDAELASAKTNAQGEFTLSYLGDSFAGQFGHRQLELTVYDKVRRVVHRELLDDTDDPLTLDREVKRADGEGLLVTLGKGTPRFVSQGNAVTLLLDKDAFEHASELFKNATRSIFVSQLNFSVPDVFATDAADEIPALIFHFHDPEPTAEAPRAAGVGDDRPERILLTAADTGVEVRILIHGFEFPLFAQLVIGALTLLAFGPAGFLGFRDLIREKLSDIHHLRRYLDAAQRPNIRAHEFRQSPISAGVLHSKLVVVDGEHALSIGSPFGQSYVDSHDHLIDAPRRGRSTGFPKHDAGFGVTGPAVADFHETTRLIWNTAVTDDPLQSITPPQQQTQGGDAISSVQLVRTLSAGRFEGDLADGEKGILEAYQRAIGSAQQFVYIETQYFTNDAIGESLVEAMKANHDLQAIVLCNIEPDVPTYPFKQRRLITRIRKAIGPEGQRPRFGVFTRWTHEVGTPRPRILPIYVHAKAAVVDDTWATIGSANLDGLSLDSSLLSDVLHKLFGAREQRAIEVNGVFVNGAAGQPQTDLVDLLRRKLFAEHLNYPSENANDLLSPPQDGWLGLWQRRAGEKRQRLVNSPAVTEEDLARVLPWPADDTTYKTPRKHLNALGVLTHKIVPLKSTRPLLFKGGEFEPGKQPEMDYD
jgi:phosphatidylserine/phosphatidylglycerophosphate/cardiolipin synthase-like enzyme